MTFTDEDLKRLKQWEATSPEGNKFVISRNDLKTLIARLEAAENFMFADEDSFDEKLEAWRKAAGKA